MDNLAHSFAGAWIGESIHRNSKSQTSQIDHERRLLYLTASIFANNAPDLDLVLSPLLPEPLGYLLHHRGHTHTAGFFLIQIALVFGLVCLIPSFRRRIFADTSARNGVALLAFVGLVVHLMFDSLNSYGVHPFWPLNSNWYYGDLVFIIEPILWASFGIPVIYLMRTRWAQAALIGLIVFVPVAATFAGIVPVVSLAILLTLMAVLVVIARKKTPEVSLLSGLVTALAFLAVQTAGQKLALTEVRKLFAVSTENELEIVLSPTPVNPLCWGFIRIAADKAGENYSLERGRISALPSMLSSSRCPLLRRDSSGGVSRETGSVSHFRALAQNDCWFEGWLRFARAPSINERRATDLRFQAQGELNFTTLPLVESGQRECPGWYPNWSKPRQDILDLAK